MVHDIWLFLTTWGSCQDTFIVKINQYLIWLVKQDKTQKIIWLVKQDKTQKINCRLFEIYHPLFHKNPYLKISKILPLSYVLQSKSSKARANIHLLLRNSLGRPLFEVGTCIMDHMIYDLWQYSSQSLIGGLWFMTILNLTISWRKMEYIYILDSKFISHIRWISKIFLFEIFHVNHFE